MFELGLIFLRLGAVSFGGPAAHLAWMRDEFVLRRAWLTEHEFLDLLGVCNVIPGPSSTEMAMQIGYRRAGYGGLIAAGCCFILPSAFLTGLLAAAYGNWGRSVLAAAVLNGIKPVVMAILVYALAGLFRTALKTWLSWILCAATGLLSASGFTLFPVTAAASGSAIAFTYPRLWWLFFKAGALVFGSGYVLIAFLRNDLVTRTAWITEAQLLDAIAMGQITPGPVFCAATFIGYRLGGVSAAIVATIAIFLPAFCFVAITAPLVKPIRGSAFIAKLLNTANAIAVGLFAAATGSIGISALRSPFGIGIFAVSAVLLWKFRWNAGWLVLGGAVAGIAGTLV